MFVANYSACSKPYLRLKAMVTHKVTLEELGALGTSSAAFLSFFRRKFDPYPRQHHSFDAYLCPSRRLMCEMTRSPANSDAKTLESARVGVDSTNAKAWFWNRSWPSAHMIPWLAAIAVVSIRTLPSGGGAPGSTVMLFAHPDSISAITKPASIAMPRHVCPGGIGGLRCASVVPHRIAIVEADGLQRPPLPRRSASAA